MIISRIHSGLGNQMFQYAAGRALAIASGQVLKLDTIGLRRDRYRKLQLDQFALDLVVARPGELSARREHAFLKRVIAKVRFLGRRKMLRIREKAHSFDPALLNIRESAYLDGFWQSEKYFIAIEDVIRRDFALRGPFSTARQKLFEQIRVSQHPVSIHVRRGDYVTNPGANALMGTLGPEWFETAMQKMTSRYGKCTFFVFSDDIGWAKQNLKSDGEIVFVDIEPDGRDAEDIHLMAACKGHIISNSSFSWWGAWLNPDREKHVIAPKVWFQKDALDGKDIVPQSWERL